MNSGRRWGFAGFTLAATLIVASILLYRIRPLAGITLGSGATAFVVLTHLGVLGALVGPLVARRRPRRHPPSQQDRRK
jgi:hypothetical protein